jgi:hypothetical protein
MAHSWIYKFPMKIPRMLIMKIHAILACFFMPLAILYFISGALYSFDIKGHVDKQVYTLALDRPFAPDLAQLSELAKTALDQRKLSLPTGSPAIKEKKGSYEYRWGDLKRQVVIHPTGNPLQVKLTYRQRSPLTQVMRVHRAEAGSLVRTYSLTMVVSLITILVTGVFLAVGTPKLRRTALVALGAGCLVVLTLFAR